MSEMSAEQMEEALKHDMANRMTNGTGQSEPLAVEVSFETLMTRLDQKNAMLAKSVSMALVDTARSYTALAMQVREGKSPEPSYAERCLVVAEHALKLAEVADRLSDKNVARADIVTPAKS